MATTKKPIAAARERTTEQPTIGGLKAALAVMQERNCWLRDDLRKVTQERDRLRQLLDAAAEALVKANQVNPDDIPF